MTPKKEDSDIDPLIEFVLNADALAERRKQQARKTI